jgi:hypothetical protein
LASHDPGKVILDLAVTLALGRDCLADVAQLRAHPEVFGPVASDPTVSRYVAALAADAPQVLAAINAARVRGWLAGEAAPDHGIDETHPLVIDVDATLVTAHTEKEQAAPTRGLRVGQDATYVERLGFERVTSSLIRSDSRSPSPPVCWPNPHTSSLRTVVHLLQLLFDRLAGSDSLNLSQLADLLLVLLDEFAHGVLDPRAPFILGAERDVRHLE